MSDKTEQKNSFNLENLRKLIDKKTREEIATALKCDTSLVTKHYNNQRIITVEHLIKYAEYFNVSVDYLLHKTHTKTPVDTAEGELKRSICEYTGLNEEAIEELHYQVELKERKQSDYPWFTDNEFFENQNWINEYLSIVNHIICSPAFQVAIGNIISYTDELKKRTISINDLIKRINAKKSLDFDSVCEIEKLSDVEHTRFIKLEHFEMIEVLKIAVEKYCKTATDKCEEAENILDEYLIESYKYKNNGLTDEEAEQLEKYAFKSCMSIKRTTEHIMQRIGENNANHNEEE